MKCPYNPAKIVTDRPAEPIFTQRDYTDPGIGETSIMVYYHPSTQTTQFVMYDCLQEGCAAWQNGACVRLKEEAFNDGTT